MTLSPLQHCGVPFCIGVCMFSCNNITRGMIQPVPLACCITGCTTLSSNVSTRVVCVKVRWHLYVHVVKRNVAINSILHVHVTSRWYTCMKRRGQWPLSRFLATGSCGIANILWRWFSNKTCSVAVEYQRDVFDVRDGHTRRFPWRRLSCLLTRDVMPAPSPSCSLPRFVPSSWTIYLLW
jgi:hypothetical protein